MYRLRVLTCRLGLFKGRQFGRPIGQRVMTPRKPHGVPEAKGRSWSKSFGILTAYTALRLCRIHYLEACRAAHSYLLIWFKKLQVVSHLSYTCSCFPITICHQPASYSPFPFSPEHSSQPAACLVYLLHTISPMAITSG